MGFSWTTFFFEVVNFLLFLWLLKRMLYAPLQRAIDERRKNLERAEQRVKELVLQSEELAREADAKRAELSVEQERVLGEARSEAQAERALILKHARDDLADLRRREQERLDLERNEAELDTARASLDVGRASAASLLRAVAAPEVNQAMTQRLLDAVGQARDMNQASRQPAELQSAFELDPDQRKQLSEQLGRRLGVEVELSFSEDPQLIAGLCLRLGETVFDASLRAQLDQVVNQARRQLGIQAGAANPIAGGA